MLSKNDFYTIHSYCTKFELFLDLSFKIQLQDVKVTQIMPGDS